MEKLIKIPSQAKSIPIGQKPKRGRPPAAKKALVRQEPPSPQEATINRIAVPSPPRQEPIAQVTEPSTSNMILLPTTQKPKRGRKSAVKPTINPIAVPSPPRQEPVVEAPSTDKQ